MPSLTFEFLRYRFQFRAMDPLVFPQWKSANVMRGAFGSVLHDTAPPAEFEKIFRPGASNAASPSGFTDWPRPFLFRAAHLDGLTIERDERFYLDVHLFDVRSSVLAHFRSTFEQLAVEGLGLGRGRAELTGVDRLDLDDQNMAEGDETPTVLGLDAGSDPVSEVRLRFVTPTELKRAGKMADRPDFDILFGRLRDRISNLRAMYGRGPLALDYRGISDSASAIEMTVCELTWSHAMRKSGRTGQVHPLGGFIGEAAYRGELREFLPWLKAARWVGVGRQTVWGKGDVRVLP